MLCKRKVETQKDETQRGEHKKQEPSLLQIMVDGYQETPEGLIYREFTEGSGELPQDGQEVCGLLKTFAPSLCDGCASPFSLDVRIRNPSNQKSTKHGS